MQAQEKRYFSPEEYLELEAKVDHKSEYLDGQIIAIAGNSTNHNQIAGNFYAALNLHLQRKDYRVFMGDVRLWIPRPMIYTYPDIMIVSGEPEYLGDRDDTITNPQILVEVLSKSTRDYDRGDKFEFYRTIPTFQEYVLVDQIKIHVEVFNKTMDNKWLLTEYNNESDCLTLSSFEFDISLIDLYDKVNFRADH